MSSVSAKCKMFERQYRALVESNHVEGFLQASAVLLGSCIIIWFGLLATGLFVYILLVQTKYAILCYLYLLWIFYDRNTCNTGGRQFKCIRYLTLWKYVANYFPVELHKTVDLSSDSNYILCLHPHGICSLSALINFATNATGFEQLFPNIESRILTLNLNFHLPIQREIYLSSGFLSANRSSLDHLLSQKTKGKAACLVVGGAVESLDAIPNRMELTIKKRKGFIRMAIQTGTSLVPCITFGENEVFNQYQAVKGSFFHRFQVQFKKMFSFTMPIFYGRGYTILPLKKPMHTIVGKPIPVTPNKNPSQTEINELHHIYMNELKSLFYTHRDKYAEDPNMDIVFK